MNINQIMQAERNRIIVEDIEVRKMKRDDIAKKHNISNVRVGQIYFDEKSKQTIKEFTPERIKAMKVTDLPLTFRLKDTIARRYGYDVTCEDINLKSDAELLSMRNFGRRTLNEWREFQLKHGLIAKRQTTPSQQEMLKLLERMHSASMDKIEEIRDMVKTELMQLQNIIEVCISEAEDKCR